MNAAYIKKVRWSMCLLSISGGTMLAEHIFYYVYKKINN